MANTDFLQFNAYRIKDLIKQKLAQDSNFTYQIYAGSNLDILIDIVSYMFQGLLYSLNTAASESMFADTQFYENINRLCTFLGYNPKGSSTPSASFVVTTDPLSSLINRVIPRYAFLETGKTDSTGKQIVYSFSTDGSKNIITDTNNKFTLYNGKWKLYTSVLTTTGIDWETFTLDIKSDYLTQNYVPHDFIDIYAYNPTKNSWTMFKTASQQLFKPINRINVDDDKATESAGNDSEKFIYGGIAQTASPNSNSILKSGIPNNVFNLRLDENKNYQITFGDGTTGAKPDAGSLLYIVYLQSNGPDGTLDMNEVEDVSLQFNSVGLGDDFWSIFAGSDNYENLGDITLTNITSSTEFRPEESVEEIRQNAPNWFRGGGRLVTKDDYESFFKYTPTIKNRVLDVKCQNNWEYVATFYRWLYELGLKNHPDDGGGRYYLNQNNLVKTEYQVADPADCNNVYIWYKPVQETEEESIPEFNRAAYAIKDMTHEPIACRGIPVNFSISAAPVGLLSGMIASKGFHVTKSATNQNGDPSYVEILMEDDVTYSNAAIISLFVDKIRQYFERDMGLGYRLNFNELMTSLYSINGISRIRTVFCPDENEPANNIVYNGLSFVSWSGTDLINIGDDMEVSPNPRSLEIFQYPIYNGGSRNSNRYGGLRTSIRIIKRNLVSLNSVQY